MANNPNASSSSNSSHTGTGKSVLYQIGVGLVALVATFLVVGFIVRTVLTLNT